MARRALRWLGIGLGAGLGVLGALTAGSLLWITSDSGNDFVRRLAIEKAAPLLNGSLRLGHLSFDLLHHLRAEGFAVCDAHGR